MNRAIPKEGIDAAGMPASRTAVRASLGRVGARQLLDGLGVAQRACHRGAGAWCAGGRPARNVVYIVGGIAGPCPRKLEDILVPVGREPRHVGTRAGIVDPDGAADVVGAPWRSSEMNCVLLNPSVTEANLTTLGPCQ